MSKLKSKDEYEKTFAFRFLRWVSGSKDPYVGEVEMQVQEETVLPQETIIARMREAATRRDKVYDEEQNKLARIFHRIYVGTAIVFCIALVGVLLVTVSYLPPDGNASNPVNNVVSERYIEQGLQETGALNIVSGMILTYRAFDTFGETNVLFIATCCVMILLMVDDAVLKKQAAMNDRRFEPKNDTILQGVAFVLCPVIFIFGIYIILNGHLSPGGGFSGGSIMGAGLILYVAAFGFQKTQRFFDEHVYKIAKITALCMYGLIGTYFYMTGANGIENHIPLGIPGHILSSGIILPINICVGLEVACTMYAFYALFRRGGL